MSKKKSGAPEEQKRQSGPWFDKPEGFDSWSPEEKHKHRMECLSQRRNSAFHRAKEKVGAFIGGCVTDPDFRHPDSAALLDLLLIVRDNLLSDETTVASKEWGLDDYLQPVLDAKLKYSRRVKKEKEQPQRDAMADAEQYVKAEWANVFDKRAHRERFSEQMVEDIQVKFGVEKAADQIRKHWLKGN